MSFCRLHVSKPYVVISAARLAFFPNFDITGRNRII